MSVTKYASFEVSEVLDIKGSTTRRHTASLDKLADFENYRTDDGYMYVRIRAISSRVNKNHDGWPAVELAGSPEIFERHAKQSSTGFTVEASEGDKEFGFATFIGKPIFVDHNNSDPKRARGVIVDAKLNVLPLEKEASSDAYYASGELDEEHLPPTEVELLLEVDAKSFPTLAKAIKDGDIDGFSMGCDVERSKCSHCGHLASSPDEYCSHIRMKGATHDFKTADGKRVARKSYENCYGIKFFEISAVFDPADPTALAREVRAAVHKEGWIDAPGIEGAPQAGQALHDDPLPGRRWQDEEAIQGHAEELMAQHGMSYDVALELAQAHQPQNKAPRGVHGEGGSLEFPQRKDYTPIPSFGNPFAGDLPPSKSQNPEDENPGSMPNQPVGPLHGLAEDMFEERWPGGRGRPVRNDPRWGKIKVAENPLPQSFMPSAPEEVDTMREEHLCPVCGENMTGEECSVCGYVEPPKGFDNPNLQKAKEVNQQMQQGDEATIQQDTQTSPSTPQAEPQVPGQEQKLPGSYLQKARNPQATASVMSDMRWQPKINPKLAARINKSEKPLKTTATPATNEPANETVISNPTSPVTSAMRTAQDLIEATKRNQTGDTMSTTRTADGPTAPEASPDTRADVTGVGGVIDSSNDAASKADAQVDVLGVGSTGVEGVEADSTATLPSAGEGSDDSGFNKDKTTQDSGPTSTYGDSDGTEKGVSDSVTNESLEGNQNKGSSVLAYDSKPFYDQEGLSGGSANKGTEPVDPIGKADDRVDVLDSTTTPENNSGPTSTWSGTDGNKVYRQQEPVTQDVVWNNTDNAWTSHIVAAIKLADIEVDLGLITKEAKYQRIAELERVSPEVIDAQLTTLANVKTAGLNRLAQARTAGVTRLPAAFGKQTAAGRSFEGVTASEGNETKDADDSTEDSALFIR